MANVVHITAGLPVAKNSGQSPTPGENTVYITAGLPPEVLTEPPTGFVPYPHVPGMTGGIAI
jgi:hypothetical protein